MAVSFLHKKTSGETMLDRVEQFFHPPSLFLMFFYKVLTLVKLPTPSCYSLVKKTLFYL